MSDDLVTRLRDYEAVIVAPDELCDVMKACGEAADALVLQSTAPHDYTALVERMRDIAQWPSSPSTTLLEAAEAIDALAEQVRELQDTIKSLHAQLSFADLRADGGLPEATR